MSVAHRAQCNLTEKLSKGEIFDVIPYDKSKRFHDRSRLM
jgi:hypothetical protein